MGTAEEVTVTIACEEENTGIDSYPNDIGLWPNEIDTFRDYWLTRGNKECRNNDSDIKNSTKTERDRTRHCTASLFTRKHSLTGEILDLSSWLCYSESTGKSTAFHANCCQQRRVILTVVSMTGSMSMKKSKLTVNHPNTEKR